MGKVINLNKARKQMARAAEQKQAEVNRRLHGRTRAERAREDLQKKQLTRAVEGARLESSGAEEPASGVGAEAPDASD